MSDLINRIYGDFDKKNEVPKVKIPKFAIGGICNDAIFPKLDVFSQIDEIVKDVRDRQDNAMAMEFTKCIGELLKKNGVTPKITEYTHENVKEHSIEQLYGVTIDELDFSEHNKVFEYKISELKKELSKMKQSQDNYFKLLDKYREQNEELTIENQELKQRIAELESENEGLKCSIDILTVSKSEWIDKAVEWQQKCEKLESKETENISEIDTSSPLACAESLIEHMTHLEKYMIMPEKNVQTFSVEELKEIADYLMVYCKHHRERDCETISF